VTWTCSRTGGPQTAGTFTTGDLVYTATITVKAAATHTIATNIAVGSITITSAGHTGKEITVAPVAGAANSVTFKFTYPSLE